MFFNWGLSVEIYPPELELRKNILKNKIMNYKNKYTSLQDISEDVIDYIAANIAEGDVRILENSLNRLMAYSSMTGCQKIDLAFAVEALKDLIHKGTSEQATTYAAKNNKAISLIDATKNTNISNRSINIMFLTPKNFFIFIKTSL